MAKKKPKKPAPKKATPKKASRKPVARSAPKKRAKAPPKVTAVRRDSRGNYKDVKTGRPVPAAKAKRFKTFFDAAGRRRATKGGKFAGGKSIAPTSRDKKRRGLVSAFSPADARERGGKQRRLLEKRKRPINVVDMRYTGKKRTAELAARFGVDLRTRGDFATLIEAQGRELGKASFHVDEPIERTDDGKGKRKRPDMTILSGVEGATRRALKGVKDQLVAITTKVTADGDEVGQQTAIVRSGERAEVVGAVMSSIFGVLGEHGLDASDGNERGRDPVSELDVSITVYELE